VKKPFNLRAEKIAKLREDGLTLRQIAALEGISLSRVGQIFVERRARATRAEGRELERARLVTGAGYRDVRVDIFELSARARHCLRNDNIGTIDDLVQLSEAELLRIPNFGRKSLNEVKGHLRAIGLCLAPAS
jgi:DNA-directed RNA polymerase alpha subunit